MSVSDAAPLPRAGEAFFDVRGNSRTMRLSWYADTGVAVFSIWQGPECTGTFRLPIDDLPRMVEILRRGPDGSTSDASAAPAALAAPVARPGQAGPARPELGYQPDQPPAGYPDQVPAPPDRSAYPALPDYPGWPADGYPAEPAGAYPAGGPSQPDRYADGYPPAAAASYPGDRTASYPGAGLPPDDYPAGNGYHGDDGYARDDAYPGDDSYRRDDSYAGDGSRHRDDSYPAHDGYLRDDGYSRDDSYSGDAGYRDDSYPGDSGYPGDDGYSGDNGYPYQATVAPGYPGGHGSGYPDQPGYHDRGGPADYLDDPDTESHLRAAEPRSFAAVSSSADGLGRRHADLPATRRDNHGRDNHGGGSATRTHALPAESFPYGEPPDNLEPSPRRRDTHTSLR